MKKSTTWQLATIILVALAALYVDLSIGHPDWVNNLLFWQPVGQRDIALRLGLDLQGGIQILLAADTPEGQEPDADAMEATRLIVENRAKSLGLAEPVVQTLDERHIVVELPNIRTPQRATEIIPATGLVEFVDAGTLFLPPGTAVETTLDGPAVEEPAEPLTPTTPANRVFETVLSSDGLETILLYRTGDNKYSINFALTQETTDAFAAHTGTHAGQYLCVALDKEILSCATLPGSPLEGGGGIPVYLLDEYAQDISILLRYGPLPVPLQVEEIKTVGPALGNTTIEQGKRAIAIGVVVILLFTLLYYRLPGGLAALALLILASFNLALCKAIPLPLTLSSVTGFAAAALLAIGAHFFIFERLREEMRAGRSLSRATEVGFSRAWPSIRSVHLVFLVLSIATWYIGATTTAGSILWLGVTLLVGTLTSLFVTMVVTRTIARLTFHTAREWLSERKWLLGI